MFEEAKIKLEDSRINLKQIKSANDVPSFRTNFNSFLNSSRAITYALQKKGAHISGFESWYKVKQEEMKYDDLLRFIHDARKEDFHEGKHRLYFSTFIQNVEIGIPPYPNASMVIGNEGPFWIINEGTPQEERIPFKQNGRYVLQVSIENPPEFHLGKKLVNQDPISICECVLIYFSNLVYEAEEKFSI